MFNLPTNGDDLAITPTHFKGIAAARLVGYLFVPNI